MPGASRAGAPLPAPAPPRMVVPRRPAARAMAAARPAAPAPANGRPGRIRAGPPPARPDRRRGAAHAAALAPARARSVETDPARSRRWPTDASGPRAGPPVPRHRRPDAPSAAGRCPAATGPAGPRRCRRRGCPSAELGRDAPAEKPAGGDQDGALAQASPAPRAAAGRSGSPRWRGRALRPRSSPVVAAGPSDRSWRHASVVAAGPQHLRPQLDPRMRRRVRRPARQRTAARSTPSTSSRPLQAVLRMAGPDRVPARLVHRPVERRDDHAPVRQARDPSPAIGRRWGSCR